MTAPDSSSSETLNEGVKRGRGRDEPDGGARCWVATVVFEQRLGVSLHSQPAEHAGYLGG